MRGQWVGNYKGTNEGFVIVDVDELPSHFQGVAYLNEQNKNLPKTIAFFTTRDKAENFQFRTSAIHPVNPDTGLIDQWENLKSRYPDVRIPTYADVSGSFNAGELSMNWETDINTVGSYTIPRYNATAKSTIPYYSYNWNRFSDAIKTLKGRGFIFRGQNQPWRLRTSFHRAGRFNWLFALQGWKWKVTQSKSPLSDSSSKVGIKLP